MTTTGGPLRSRWSVETVSMTFRKNTVAALGSPASEPDAILICDEVSFENPVPASSDQRTIAFGCEEGFEPMESTHACVALTFSDRPWVDGLTLAAPTADVDTGEKEATCTFTRGGTVTVTVCMTLLEDPRWATAARESIALPIMIANSERRILTILQSSSYCEPKLSNS